MDMLPNNRNTAPQPTMHQSNSSQLPPAKKDSSRKFIFAIVALSMIVLLLAGGWLWSVFSNDKTNKGAKIDESSYQSVFLTNGQVYFGKLQNTSGDYVQLTDIYYLQSEQTLQPSSDKNKEKAADSQKTQLVKLGNELHGPKDSMQISSKQVLFWENLKSDGKVSEAIKSYKP